MFDIGFLELFTLFTVALLVVGPERLPAAARTCSLYWGRLRRSIQKITAEIEHEVGVVDVKHQLHNEAILQQHPQDAATHQQDNDTPAAGDAGIYHTDIIDTKRDQAKKR